MASVIAEILAHRTSRIGSEELHRCRIGCGRGNDDRIVHRAVVLKLLDDLSNGRGLLPDSNVNADNVLAFLVDDRVDRDSGLARLAVADYQLTLSAADRHHCVDRFEAGLQGFFHRLAVDNAGSDTLDRVIKIGDDLAFAVDRVAESVDDAADHCVAHRNAHDALRPLCFVAFLDLLKIAEEHAPDLIFLKVKSEPANAVRKLEQFAGHYLFQPVNLGDAVADLDDRSDLVDRHARIEILYLGSNYLVDLVSFDCFHKFMSPKMPEGVLRLLLH